MSDMRPTRIVKETIDTKIDPISGAAGAHPVGVGVGAIGVGAASGAVGGIIGGPVGMVAGAAIGAAIGGLAGKAAAEAIDPTVELKYWHETHASMPYAGNGYAYNDFEPAYRYGWDSFTREPNKHRTFESAESDLSRGWDNAKGSSRLAWSHAKQATKRAWHRVQDAVTPDSKSNGYAEEPRGLGSF